MRAGSSRPVLRLLLALLPLALAWSTLRDAIESRMSWHMLGELPLLLASGWCAATLVLHRVRARRWLRRQRQIDWRGWTTAVTCSAVALVSMLPLALDAVLLWPAAAAAKYVAWWLAGWLLADGWRRMDGEVLLFGVGNLAWMMATAGLLYLDAPVRLCVNYLQDDQRHAGIGLVALALAVGILALRRALATPQSRGAAARSPAAS